MSPPSKGLVLLAIMSQLTLPLGQAGAAEDLEDEQPAAPAQRESTNNPTVDKKTPALPVVASEHASMEIGLVLQTGFDIAPNELEGERNTFSLHRARLKLGGHLISKKISYYFEGDAASSLAESARLGSPGTEIVSENGEVEVPFLLDAKLSFAVPIIGLTLSVGRFVPKWGLTMTENVTRIGAVSYPLYVQGSEGSLGVFRNIGVEAIIEFAKIFQVGGGVFNGEKNSWLDDNDRKDIMAFVGVNPLPGLEMRAASLFAFPNATDEEAADTSETRSESETHIMPIFEARYRDYGFDIMAGVAAGMIFRAENDARDDYESYGFMGHIGYILLGDWFEMMGRVEWWEPDNETPFNEQTRITVGPQFLFESIRAGLNINYVQDIFSGERQMCELYLDISDCQNQQLPPEAKSSAATVYIQFFLDL